MHIQRNIAHSRGVRRTASKRAEEINYIRRESPSSFPQRPARPAMFARSATGFFFIFAHIIASVIDCIQKTRSTVVYVSQYFLSRYNSHLLSLECSSVIYRYILRVEYAVIIRSRSIISVVLSRFSNAAHYWYWEWESGTLAIFGTHIRISSLFKHSWMWIYYIQVSYIITASVWLPSENEKFWKWSRWLTYCVFR